MGFLFSKPKNDEDERRKCLRYLEEEAKVVAFQGKEEDLCLEVEAKYGQARRTDSHAAEEMCRAANRLVQAAKEILRRREEMVSIPDVASSLYWAWQLAYQTYLQGVEAYSAVLQSEAEGMIPNHEYHRRCVLQYKDARKIALKELGELAKRLNLSRDVVRKMHEEALVAVKAEDWQPGELNR